MEGLDDMIIICAVCNTQISISPNQVGMPIVCPDCGTEIEPGDHNEYSEFYDD